MGTKFSIRRSLAVLSVAVAAVAVLPATPALAHAELKSAVPAAGATVATAPDSIMILFSESIEAKFSGIVLTGADKATFKTGAAAVEGKGHDMLVVPIVEPLKAGLYTVSWHNLSSDGHKLKGSFSFTMKP